MENWGEHNMLPVRMSKMLMTRIIPVGLMLVAIVNYCYPADVTSYNCGNQGYWSWHGDAYTAISSIVPASASEYVGGGSGPSMASNGFLVRFNVFGDAIWTKSLRTYP
jgi:hypothetical protein